MNRAVSITLWVGTLAGVALCGAATAAHAVGGGAAAGLARLGALALLATPPLRLAVVALGFAREGRPRLAAASLLVLIALVATAIGAAF